MAIGNPHFGRFKENDEEVYKNESEETADPNAETEEDILERIDKEKEEEKEAQKERRETPPAIADPEDTEDLPTEFTEEKEEGKDFAQLEDDSLPSKMGARKGADMQNSNSRLLRKPEKRFYRTKKIQEDKRLKKKKAA